ncbi:MAG: GTPase HflX [Chloroflexi bacterium RBG_13_68_17]|nr:MAG: GTPase HflX [Chloroflexi bacterium RBG_13_68_17]
MSRESLPTISPRERALLVGVEIDGQARLLPMPASLRELALLAQTANLDVIGETGQRLHSPNPKTLIGAGKVEELQELAEELAADVLLFDDELSPRHQRELESAFGDGVRVLDRTALILDIFAQHAHTREGALQVELAQYEYRLPRLTRAWTHLARQAGGGAGRSGSVGGVGLRGPGETQLEVDRREIGRRIAQLRRELEKVRAHRSRYRARRKQTAVPVLALVGYTNAGKSTLLNRLAGADVYVADQLFATLDPTTRRIRLPSGAQALVTDTVGFIQKLPTMLVAAFRATLEEIAEADVLVHVVDITHPDAVAQAESVRLTLEELGAHEAPMVTALNKVDLLDDRRELVSRIDEFDRAVPVSAVSGEGLPALLATVEAELLRPMAAIEVHLPYDAGRLISLFHEYGRIEHEEHGPEAVLLRGRIPRSLLSEFSAFRRPRGHKSGRRQPAA